MTVPVSAREAARLAQAAASDPGLLGCWVDASAGSGKTKVLTDRVLRLLLREDQKAGRILCLTFTRAAAAEMRTRIATRLGDWAVAEEAALAEALATLGCPTDPATRRRARSLFAEVLELPGGMRISTIHGFCQSLLHAFPLEAGLAPQFRVLEEADAAALHAEAREAVLSGAVPGRGAGAALALLAGLVDAGSFAGAVGALLNGRNRERLAECLRASNGLDGLRLRLAGLLGLEADMDEPALLRDACRIPDPVLRAAAALVNHKDKRARDLAARMRDWLDRDHDTRAAGWDDWCGNASPPAVSWRRRRRCCGSPAPSSTTWSSASAAPGCSATTTSSRSPPACCATRAAPGCCSSSMAGSITCCSTRRRTATRRSGRSPGR